MNTKYKIEYTIELLSDWHCGSGLGAGAYIDNLVLRDCKGRPFVPGKTLKGLARENAELLVSLDKANEKKNKGKLNRIFGVSSAEDSRYKDDGVFFESATSSDDIKTRTIQQICIDDRTGTTKDGSLRSLEVSEPCILSGVIYDIDDDCVELVQNSMMMIKRLGLNRNRGLGRCKINVSKKKMPNSEIPCNHNQTLKFKCTLLSDVILNSNSSTEQKNTTLDYIPGNVFLGIAAKKLYGTSGCDSMKMFHSGDVRWGDAHIGVMENDGRYRRTHHIPASLYQEKTNKDKFLQHHLNTEEVSTQLVQFRQGFYNLGLSAEEYDRIAVGKKYYLKSTYAKWNQKAKEKQLFGVEALTAGNEFLFEVSLADGNEELRNVIINALVGDHRIGASSSAEFGRIHIEQREYQEAGSQAAIEGDEIYIYADSRLIFLDENSGEMTCAPENILGHQIVWEKSQIRTFEYYPWNGKRSSRDAGRYGIEKGSVIILKSEGETIPQYIGAYQNEGFGRILIHPEFLTRLIKVPSKDPEEQGNINKSIYELVLKYCRKENNGFTANELSPSQWGAVRNLASLYHDNPSEAEKKILSFIDSGTKRWGRKQQDALKSFINEVKSSVENDVPKAIALLCSNVGKIVK